MRETDVSKNKFNVVKIAVTRGIIRAYMCLLSRPEILQVVFNMAIARIWD